MKSESETESLPEFTVSAEGAVEGAPAGESGGGPSTCEEKELEEKKVKVLKRIVLRGEVTFIKMKVRGTKGAELELILNRVRLAQRKRELRYGKLVGTYQPPGKKRKQR